MKKLGEELGNTYRQYRDEKCARRLLISDMNDQKNLADHAAETKENGKILKIFFYFFLNFLKIFKNFILFESFPSKDGPLG